MGFWVDAAGQVKPPLGGKDDNLLEVTVTFSLLILFSFFVFVLLLCVSAGARQRSNKEI